jgi:hypothetical protein
MTTNGDPRRADLMAKREKKCGTARGNRRVSLAARAPRALPAVLPVLFFSLALLNGCGKGKNASTHTNIFITRESLANVKLAVELYRREFGEYPDSLDGLLSRKSIGDKRIIQDAWGRKYHYARSGDGYVLFSKGGDGEPYTKDDVYPPS